jgi:hypothetical protein
MTWLRRLEDAQVGSVAPDGDRWRRPPERLHGQIGDDGVERITTQRVLDVLEVPQRAPLRRLPSAGEADDGVGVECQPRAGTYESGVSRTGARVRALPDAQMSNPDAADRGVSFRRLRTCRAKCH